MTGKVYLTCNELDLDRLASMRPGHYDREGEVPGDELRLRHVASMRPGHYDREGRNSEQYRGQDDVRLQ